MLNPTAEQVANYLTDHPDFFVEREILLLGMHLPHTAPGTISLVERQAALMRERVATMERAMRDLHVHAQANENLASRMHRLALALMAAGDPCAVLEAARTRLCTDFNLVGALIALEDGQPLTAPCITPPQGAAWSALFELKNPQIPRTSGDLRELMISHGLPETASLAAIPLRGKGFRGALLLVKREPQGFRPDMGTLFLEQIGTLISTALERTTPPAAMPEREASPEEKRSPEMDSATC